MQMKKMVAAATIVMAGLSVGGSAFAGEFTGGPNPKPTPIDDFGHAQSICAFSGQNDDPSGGGIPIEVGKVQNWGHTLANAKEIFTPAQLEVFLATRAPSVTCNGSTGIIAG
jgi:hypothetical protein